MDATGRRGRYPTPGIWLLVGAICLSPLSLAACRRDAGRIDPASRRATAGTVSGTVRGAEGAGGIEGRAVDAINVVTGERRREITSATGGFSFKLEPGAYRVELALRDGESFIAQPGVIDLTPLVADAHADFVVGVARTSHPRRPVSPVGSILGPPIA